jgi:hypothetical protein
MSVLPKPIYDSGLIKRHWSALTRTTPGAEGVKIEKEEESILQAQLKREMRRVLDQLSDFGAEQRRLGIADDNIDWSKKYIFADRNLVTYARTVIESQQMDQIITVDPASAKSAFSDKKEVKEFEARITFKEIATGVKYTLSCTLTESPKERKPRKPIADDEMDSMTGGSNEKGSTAGFPRTINVSFIGDNSGTAASHIQDGLSASNWTNDARVPSEEVSLGNSSNGQ